MYILLKNILLFFDKIFNVKMSGVISFFKQETKDKNTTAKTWRFPLSLVICTSVTGFSAITGVAGAPASSTCAWES